MGRPQKKRAFYYARSQSFTGIDYGIYSIKGRVKPKKELHDSQKIGDLTQKKDKGKSLVLW